MSSFTHRWGAALVSTGLAATLLASACTPAAPASPTAAPAAQPTAAKPAVAPTTAPAAAPAAQASAAAAPAAQASPAAAGTTAPAAAPSTYQPLKMTIGHIVPLTGGQAAYGPAMSAAGTLAAKALNDAAQQDGLPITIDLKVEDDQGQPDTAQQAATKLVTGGATCISGTLASALTLAIAQGVAIPRGIPEIAYGSSSPTLTTLDDNNLVYRTIASDDLQGPVLAQLAAKGLGGASGKTLNIGARNDDYGANLAKGVAKAWESMGGKNGQLVLWDPNATTYDADAQKVMGGNPDGWVIIDFVATFQKVAPALVRTGKWDPKRTFVTALQVPNLPDLIGKDVVEGLRGTAPGYSKEAAEGSAFDNYWKANSQTPRNALDVNAFDSAIMCGLAAIKADSSDPAAIKAALPQLTGDGGTAYDFTKLPDVLKALAAGQKINYHGVSGALAWDKNGDVTDAEYGIIEFQNSKLVLTDILTVTP